MTLGLFLAYLIAAVSTGFWFVLGQAVTEIIYVLVDIHENTVAGSDGKA